MIVGIIKNRLMKYKKLIGVLIDNVTVEEILKLRASYIEYLNEF